MTITFNLAALLNVLLAAAGVWATRHELRGTPVKLWRLAVAPILCTMTSLVMLANTPTVHMLELMWMVAGLWGVGVGAFVGNRVQIRTDQMWGLVQFKPSYVGLIAAGGVLVMVLADSAAVWLGLGHWSPGQDPAVGAALLSGFLDGRAYKMAANAVQSPHADLNV